MQQSGRGSCVEGVLYPRNVLPVFGAFEKIFPAKPKNHDPGKQAYFRAGRSRHFSGSGKMPDPKILKNPKFSKITKTGKSGKLKKVKF